MSRKVNPFKLFYFCLIFLFSCTAVNDSSKVEVRSLTEAPVNDEVGQNWWTLWLHDPICETPCWMNITPGKTSASDALSILNEIPHITVLSNDYRGANLRFDTTKTDSGAVNFSDNKVDMIWLGNSNEDELLLNQIVDIYKTPDYIKLYDCRNGTCATVLIYPKIGLLVDLYLKDISLDYHKNQISLKSNDRVYGVYFIEPGIDNFSGLSVFEEGELLQWDGYGLYP